MTRAPRRRPPASPGPAPAGTAWPSSRPWLRPGPIGLAALVIVGALLPLLLSPYNLYIASQVVIYAVATIGMNVVFGTTGQLSLAQGAFFGLGAYTAGYIYLHTLISPIGELAIVIVVSLLAGLVVGLPALRVSGLRLAVVTLAFGELFIWWLNNAPTDVTGGQQGLTVGPILVGGLSEQTSGYVLALVTAVIISAVALRLGRTPAGRMMLAVRESEAAATSVGGSLVRTKLTAFMISACFAGIAGWLFAHDVGSLSPSTFDIFPSIYFLVAVIIGGTGSVLGSWIGAAYLILVPQAVASVGATNLYPLISGALLILVIVLLPGGAVSLARYLPRPGRGGSR